MPYSCCCPSNRKKGLYIYTYILQLSEVIQSTYHLSKCKIFLVYTVDKIPRQRSLFLQLALHDQGMVSESAMNAVRRVQSSQFFNMLIRKLYHFVSESQMATGQIKFLTWHKDHKCSSQGYLSFNKMKSSMCCFVLILQVGLSIYKP